VLKQVQVHCLQPDVVLYSAKEQVQQDHLLLA
jgi:hypothetical protein